MRLPNEPNSNPTYIFNPLKQDFVCYFADENNTQKKYIVLSQQIKEFPKYLADHIAKHLSQKIALDDDPNLAYEIRYNNALKRVTAVII